MTSRLILTWFTFLCCGVAHGDDLPDWLKHAIKQEEPNDLAYYVYVYSECPFSSEHIAEIVDGVLIRSRIKPNKSYAGKDLYLDVDISCLQVTNTNSGAIRGYAYSSKICFGQSRVASSVWVEVVSPSPRILYDYDFGTFGLTADRKGLVDSVKEDIEEAVTAYLEANFDLSSD